MRPGQRIMAGTRNAPSQLVSFSLRNGVVAASGHDHWFGPVVGRIDDEGVVGDAEIVERLQELADVAIVFDHAVGIFIAGHAALSLHGLTHMGEGVHPGGVHPGEERFIGPRLPLHEVDRRGGRFVIDGFHPLPV
jgi:hypothetical protein